MNEMGEVTFMFSRQMSKAVNIKTMPYPGSYDTGGKRLPPLKQQDCDDCGYHFISKTCWSRTTKSRCCGHRILHLKVNTISRCRSTASDSSQGAAGWSAGWRNKKISHWTYPRSIKYRWKLQSISADITMIGLGIMSNKWKEAYKKNFKEIRLCQTLWFLYYGQWIAKELRAVLRSYWFFQVEGV